MPASYNVHSGLVDVIFSWVDADIPLAQEIVGGCALYLWRRGYGPTTEVDGEIVQVPWIDLTNQEKLDMVYRMAKRAIIESATTALVDTDVNQARDDALYYAEENYDLTE